MRRRDGEIKTEETWGQRERDSEMGRFIETQRETKAETEEG